MTVKMAREVDDSVIIPVEELFESFFWAGAEAKCLQDQECLRVL